MQETLQEWVKAEQAKRNWSLRELAAKAELPHSSVGRVNQAGHRVGLHVCLGLSRAFNVPIVNVLQIAELIPPEPPETRDTRLLTHIYHQLDEKNKKELVRYAEYLRDR